MWKWNDQLEERAASALAKQSVENQRERALLELARTKVSAWELERLSSDLPRTWWGERLSRVASGQPESFFSPGRTRGLISPGEQHL